MDNRRNMFFYYNRDGETDDKVETLQNLAIENGFTIVDNHKDANLIVSVGGDGAFLQAVRKTGFRQDCLYTGITREGQSGLYCDFNIDNFDQMLHSLQHDELEVRRFRLLKHRLMMAIPFIVLTR